MLPSLNNTLWRYFPASTCQCCTLVKCCSVFLALLMIEYILVSWTECLCFSIRIVQSLSRVQLFATPWTAAHQASLSSTISWNLFKLMSIGSVMSSNQSCPLSSASPPPFSISQHRRHGTVCSGHEMGAAWMSISRLMDERAVVHIHNGVLLSH